MPEVENFKLSKDDHIYLMAICGTAMGSLAGLLKDMGYKVTGSDENVYPPMSTQLEEMGITIEQGFKPENLEPKPDLVVVGNVVTRKFEESQALLASDIPYTSLPKAISELIIEDRDSLVVSGTHGKTTTTSILTWIAEVCGKEPGYLIGGIPGNFDRSYRVPKQNTFIIEGDEYDTAFFAKVPKFIYYKPKYVILTSVEFDHADIYNDMDDVRKAFTMLVERIPEDGLLVAHADDKEVMKLAELAKCKVVTYGLETGDYVAINRDVVVGRNQFTVKHNSVNEADLAAKLYGPHNTLNLLASYALASELGWSKQKILQGIADFKGVKRRQEVLGEPGGITVIEDFAHHPTAVDLTLKTMRERYPGKKVFAVFEPRSATSRRSFFQDDYAMALSQADVTILSKPYNQTNIKQEDRLSADKLLEDIRQQNAQAELFSEVDEIVSFLSQQAKTGDLILIMSNGGFGGIYQKLLEKLS